MKTGLAAALISTLPFGLAQAQDRTIFRTTKAGQETAINHALRWNKNCDPLVPKLVLTVPPEHGSVCARDFITIARRNVVSDDQTCIGKRIRGLQIIYSPRSDYAGRDSLDYVVQFPGKSFNWHADIEIKPGNAPPAPAAGDESFAPGKAGDVIVACAPLSS